MEQVCELIAYRIVCWLYFPNLLYVNMQYFKLAIFTVVYIHVMELWSIATFHLVDSDESYGGTSQVPTNQKLKADT
jgi:hypothetical protein